MRKTRSLIILSTICALVMALATGCRGAGHGDLPEGGDTLTSHARLLTLIDHGGGIVSARVADPWNGGKTLATYILVDRSVPEDKIPDIEGATVITVPIQSAIVYSGVHTGAMEELGAADAITGVADARYFTSPTIRNGLASHRIADVGNSMSPSLDRIIDLDPDVVILSPYENSGHGILEKTGIAILDMADYMEPTPLGRAEWMLFIGALTGRLDRARQIYSSVTDKYNALTTKTADVAYRPLVITEMPFNGVWYQPGGNSYQARLIHDAGGRPLLDGDTSTGSVQMDIANVYDRAVNADIWLIKSDSPISRDDIASVTPLAREIRAFQNRGIYHANTMTTAYYDDIAFHPERILADMAAIIHPDTAAVPLRYFTRL